MKSPFAKFIEEWKSLYNDGKSTNDIALMYNCSDRTVAKLLKNNGVELRPAYAISKYSIDTNYFNVINSDDKAYWLGFIYADGCIEINEQTWKNRLSINLAEKDKEHLYKFKKCISAEQPITKDRNSYRIVIDNKDLVHSLLKFGLTPRKSLTLKYPTNIPKEFNASFIRGYFDGDGSIFKDGKSLRCTILGTNEFLTSLKCIIETELMCTLPDIRIVRNIHALQFGGKETIDKFKKWIYNNSMVHLDRKYDKFRVV